MINSLCSWTNYLYTLHPIKSQSSCSNNKIDKFKTTCVERVRLDLWKIRLGVKLVFLYFSQVINKMTELEDDTGKKMKAIEIYDPLIKHLIEKLIKRFQSQVHIHVADVKLVLMLPTQSNERIIQIFHNAALKVYILCYNSYDHSISPFI